MVRHPYENELPGGSEKYHRRPWVVVAQAKVAEVGKMSVNDHDGQES